MDGAIGLIFVSALEADEAGVGLSAIFDASGFMGISCAFSTVTSSFGGGMSLPSDKSAAMAILVSSVLAVTMTVPICWPVDVLALLLDGVGVALVVTVFVVPFIVPRGDICFLFLWAAKTVLEGFLSNLGLRRLRGG